MPPEESRNPRLQAMSKTLLIGPAGSGKTRHLLDAFEAALRSAPDPLADDFFFVLPSAEHTERIISLVIQRGIKGFFHRRVTTFSRLINDIFRVSDEGVATNVTRYLILRDILEKGSWPCFEDVQKSPGFLNWVLSFILEMKESLVGAADFRVRMNGLKTVEPDLADKYEALASIYEAYQAALAQKGLRDRQDDLAVYLERKKSGVFKPAAIREIWMDGFFDFSGQQLAYLGELSQISGGITVTLTADPDPLRPELFEPLRRTEQALREMGFAVKALKPRPASGFPAPLAVIERHLFSPDKPARAVSADDTVTVLEAVGMDGEIEMIARSIEIMHRTGGCRFSDFAILLRQVGDYEDVIRSVFVRYRIPVEMHERERLAFSPLIQVIVGLLKIFREGWRRSDLVTFLKSSYVRSLGGEPKDYEWVSRLEHAAMLRGIFSGRQAWLSDWFPGPVREDSGAGDMKELDAQKAARLKCLAGLEDRLRGAAGFAELKKAMLAAVDQTFGIFRIDGEAGETVRRDAAGRRRFEALLDEIGFSFRSPAGGGEKDAGTSFDQFADRFFRLAELDLYSLHERDRNRVQVYGVSLARQKEYRVVFAAGLLEKRFPLQIREDPVLSDWERRLFNGAAGRVILKERLPTQRLERYLFYLALTRATEKIFLSYPRLDLEGNESLPSYYVSEVLSLFGGRAAGKKQDLAHPYPRLADAVNRRELEMAVMGELWTPDRLEINREPLVVCLASRLLEDAAVREKFRRAFYEVADELTDPGIAALGVFRSLNTSSTGLEEYAKCPFKYYANRVLKLNDPEQDANVTARGIILHDVLEKCFRAWADHHPEVFKNKAEAKVQALRQLGKTLGEHPLLLEKKYQLDLEIEDLREMLEKFLDQELDRLSESPLKPAYFEYAFGTPGSAVQAFGLADGARTIRISGKIDRIDTDPERTAGLVIDYKRTAVFEKKDLELGVALQLPVYSMVIREFLKLKPAGAELYSIREREKKGFYHKDYLRFFPGVGSRRMILSEEEFQAVLERCAEFIRFFSRGMEAMAIPVRPRKCESYCPYAPVCRIEKWRLPVIVEEIKREDEMREARK